MRFYTDGETCIHRTMNKWAGCIRRCSMCLNNTSGAEHKHSICIQMSASALLISVISILIVPFVRYGNCLIVWIPNVLTCLCVAEQPHLLWISILLCCYLYIESLFMANIVLRDRLNHLCIIKSSTRPLPFPGLARPILHRQWVIKIKIASRQEIIWRILWMNQRRRKMSHPMVDDLESLRGLDKSCRNPDQNCTFFHNLFFTKYHPKTDFSAHI